jgi:hypothetical protein
MRLDQQLAAELASRLLRPSVLDEGLRSGLFLVRQWDDDRWQAFAWALVAELRCLGAEVLFVDAAESRGDEFGPIEQDMRTKMSAVRRRLMPIAPAQQIVPCGKTLSDLIKSIVDLSRNDLVLIVDHASQLKCQCGGHLLKALKAARDAVNVPAGAKGNFLLVAADPDPTVAGEFTTDSDQAFLGAAVLDLTKA